MHVNIKPELIEVCKIKLLKKRQELLNQSESVTLILKTNILRGDAGDMVTSIQLENQAQITNTRIKKNLIDIDTALSKIENRSYGFCEHLDEPIEEDRLLALPWTRYCIEGAEVLENNRKRYSQTRL